MQRSRPNRVPLAALAALCRPDGRAGRRRGPGGHLSVLRLRPRFAPHRSRLRLSPEGGVEDLLLRRRADRRGVRGAAHAGADRKNSRRHEARHHRRRGRRLLRARRAQLRGPPARGAARPEAGRAAAGRLHTHAAAGAQPHPQEHGADAQAQSAGDDPGAAPRRGAVQGRDPLSVSEPDRSRSHQRFGKSKRRRASTSASRSPTWTRARRQCWHRCPRARRRWTPGDIRSGSKIGRSTCSRRWSATNTSTRSWRPSWRRRRSRWCARRRFVSWAWRPEITDEVKKVLQSEKFGPQAHRHRRHRRGDHLATRAFSGWRATRWRGASVDLDARQGYRKPRFAHLKTPAADRRSRGQAQARVPRRVPATARSSRE